MKHVITIFLSSFLIFGCVKGGVEQTKTQLQIREFQTKNYETKDTKMVMKAMLNVLQDDGYIVKNAVSDMGLLTAEKTIDVEDKGQAFMATLFAGQHAKWNKASVIECSGNISEFGNHVKVRVNFQVKTIDNKGGIAEVKVVEDENYYQEFFSKVDKGVFIQKEKI